MNGPFSPWEKDRMRGKMIIYLDPLTPTLGSGILRRPTSSIPGVVSLGERVLLISAGYSLISPAKPRRRCF